MRLAGLTVPDEDVLELAVLLRRGGFADTADTLQADVAANRPDIAHTILAREAMIGALDDPPTKALSELRGVLLEGARGPRPGRACVARGKSRRLLDQRVAPYPASSPTLITWACC